MEQEQEQEQFLDTLLENGDHLSEAGNPANIFPTLLFLDEAFAFFCAIDGDIKKVIGKIRWLSAKEMTDPESRRDLEIVLDILMRVAEDCLHMYRRWILEPMLYLQQQTTPGAHPDQNEFDLTVLKGKR
jgi:hypothetical protein